jgi:hypothetical protein
VALANEAGSTGTYNVLKLLNNHLNYCIETILDEYDNLQNYQ